METKIEQLYKREDFACMCSWHQLNDTDVAKMLIPVNGHYVQCEAEEAAKVANQLVKQRLGDHGLLWCPHPGCCCVCGHQRKCPEDGPSAVYLPEDH